MHQRKRVVITVAALACLTVACGPKGASDQALTTEIQAKLYADGATKAANVKVAVTDGAVTLSGDVPSPDVELEAMKIANGTAGVKNVNDQMKVNTVAAAAPPPMPVAQTPAPMMPPVPMDAPERRAPQREPTSYPREPDRRDGPGRGEERRSDDRPPALRTITIPAGERLSVRMIDGIDTARNTEGQTFRASLDAPLTSDGMVIVPAGAPVTVLLASAKGAGRIRGQSELELRVTTLDYRGERIPINSSVYEAQGSARGKQTAIRTGIGAAAGAVIGAIAGGGKGAAIGSLAGGGAGAGYQLATHGQQVKVPSETQLTFRLEAPITLRR